MDLDYIALFTVALSSVIGLGRGLSSRERAARGWLVVFAALLVLCIAAWRLAPGWGGLAVGALWALVVLGPSMASRRLGRAMQAQHFRRARWIARLIGVLHPADGWREQPRLIDALERSAHGDVEGAVAIFAELRDRGTPSLSRMATAQVLRLSGRWDELCEWLENHVPPDELARDPSLVGSYLRALGECRGPEPLARAWLRFETTLSSAAPAVLDTARLFFFAFAGRRDLVEHLIATRLGDLPETIRRFWLATAELAAGRVTAGFVELEQLRDTGDPIVRSGVADRLARSLPTLGTTLSPGSRALLDRVVLRLDEENRYGDGATSTKTARPYTVYALGALLCAVFAVEWAMGGTMEPEVLFKLGAFVPMEVWRRHEWWRLGMFTVLHFGPLHLGMNLFGLWVLGPFVERALGPLRFVVVWLAASVGGGVVALGLWVLDIGNPEQLLVGASGGVMGLVGATAAVLLRGWRRENAQVARQRLQSVAIMVAAQVVFDLSTPQVSFTAHSVGLVLGFLAALPMRPRIALVDHRSAR